MQETRLGSLRDPVWKARSREAERVCLHYVSCGVTKGTGAEG